jgi:flavorubredoxin
MDIHTVVAFQPRFELPPAETDTSWFLDATIDWSIFEPGDVLDWAPGRSIEVMRTPFRLLITVWPYDPKSRTLFTSDAFDHVTRSERDGSPVVTDADADPTRVDDVIDHLDSGKFGWLAKADTTTIAEGVQAIFAERDIERIAPSFGCVLEGRAVVERHVELFLEALARLSVGTIARGS